MSFLYAIKEHKKDGHRYIEITGYEGKAQDLVVPASVEIKDLQEDLKVEAIGNHAFSGRGDIVTVTLPATIKTLYGFAFHNCQNLKKISLFDSLDDYYDGVCRQCDKLTDIELTINRGWFEVARNFLADSDRTLRFKIIDSDRTALLTFPEYVYDFNENTMARTIQFSIAGSGMFYRECVDRRSIDFRGYDRLFEKAKIDGGEISEDIAIGRVLYPLELDEKYRLEYEEYLRSHGEAILLRLIKDEKSHPENLKILTALLACNNLFYDRDIDSAIAFSAEHRLTEISAILMQYGSSKASSVEKFEF